MLEKLKSWFTLFITNFILFASPVLAEDGKPVEQSEGGSNFQDTYNGAEYFGNLIDKTSDRAGALTNVNKVLLDVLGFARGAGIVVCIIMLIWCGVQLAMSSGNNQKRQLAMEGIKNVIIATAIVGAATLIISIAYGLLSSPTPAPAPAA